MKKLRRRRIEEEFNHESWLLPYADMITLMLAFFIIMYAMSLEDKKSFRNFAFSVRAAFGNNVPLTIKQNTGIHPVKGEGKYNLDKGVRSETVKEIKPVKTPFPDKGNDSGFIPEKSGILFGNGRFKGSTRDLNNMNKKIDYNPFHDNMIKGNWPEYFRKFFMNTENELKNGSLHFSLSERGLELSFRRCVLFDNGSAKLSSESGPLLDHLATLLTQLPDKNIIRIEGHTDNIPISSMLYPSNWELSTARATSVIRYLSEDRGINSSRFEAAGYGKERPIETNSTIEGRMENRRVDVIILGFQNEFKGITNLEETAFVTFISCGIPTEIINSFFN